ncbi:hypothetical protein Q604_UNBC18689G0007, partial [human gut metagenome]
FLLYKIKSLTMAHSADEINGIILDEILMFYISEY